MRAIWAVYKREVAYYFRSTIAYAIAFGLMLFFGILFSANLVQIVDFNLQASQFQQQPVPATDLAVNSLFTLTFLLFVVAPLLTMRLLSEEAREGTLEVLMTLPMSDTSFVVGKFLAAWTFYTVLLALTFVHVFVASTMGQLDWGLLGAAYAGAWLYGGAVLSVTLIWSALTEDQIVSAFLGSASVLVLFLANQAAVWADRQGIAAGAADFIRELSLSAHYQDTMLQGIVRAEDVIYFILLMVASVFITTRIVETRRWRAS